MNQYFSDQDHFTELLKIILSPYVRTTRIFLLFGNVDEFFEKY